MKWSLAAFIAIPALLALFLISASGNWLDASPILPMSKYDETTLIVKFKDDVNITTSVDKSGTITTGLPAVDALHRKYSVKEQTPFIQNLKSYKSRHPFAGVQILHVQKGANLEMMKKEYELLPYVEYAELNQVAELFGTNDYLYGYQWPLHNTGQPFYAVSGDSLVMDSGLVDVDIDAEEVFNSPPASADTVVVAVIDNGLDIDHSDLSANMWANPDEVSGNDIDDDHNGYIDDICGWNFGHVGTGSSTITEYPGSEDAYGHGTFVAGIVAATPNNDIGIAGVCPYGKIMAMQYWDYYANPHNGPWTSVFAQCIIYAAENGADVINMSTGWYSDSQLLRDAVEYAISLGSTVVVAIGNESYTIFYPAAYDNVITVGSCDAWNYKDEHSVAGSHLDVLAPGVSILSLNGEGTGVSGLVVDEYYYVRDFGTSFAAPHVAGIAAYLRAVSPGLLPEQVMDIITSTAIDILDPLNVGDSLVGYDTLSGYGRVNLDAALDAAPDRRAIISDPVPFEIVNGSVTVTGYADGNDFGSYVLEYGAVSDSVSWQQITSSASSVTNGTLGTWNTSSLDGSYFLRVRVDTTNAATVLVNVANDSLVSITSPTESDMIIYYTEITGSASCPDFDKAIVEYADTASPSVWDTISILTVPVYDTTLSDWYIEIGRVGGHMLRLSVYNSTGLVEADTVSVSVYMCGDCNHDEAIDIDDYVYLNNYVFNSGPAPLPWDSGNVNCADGIDVDDIVYLIAYIFQGGPAPCDTDNDGELDC